MTFVEFQKVIHQHDFLIVCLNDYKREGIFYTFVAIQNKLGHGYHAEGRTDVLSDTLEELVAQMQKSKGE
ncbi:MAG: hypothetical protein AAB515_00310 [Patescibacteria group bacterium]